MSARPITHTLPEELISFVCDHYARQRQLGSLAKLMRLNRRTSAYVRQALYRQYDFIDNRTSHFLEGANTICEEYEGGEELDDDILAAIDCREVDPLDLDEGLRWLRSIRTVKVMEIRDMLYGRDTESLLTLARSLARRGILLFPKLEEVIISAQVVRRIHSAEAKYPKSTPMDTLIILFLGSHTTRLRISGSTAFASPLAYQLRPGAPSMRMPLPISLPSSTVGHLVPPHERAHISHAIIQYMSGMRSLKEVIYEKVDPFIPVKPKRGVKHTVSFRPYVQPSPTAPSSSSSRSTSHGEPVDERSYIWEIRQAIVDIVQRSVVSTDHNPTPNTNGTGNGTSPSVDDAEDEADEATSRPVVDDDAPIRQSVWHFILPFSSESSQWASTLRLQVRDRIRRKYEDDPELVEEVLGNMTFEFKEG